jgi:2-dehydro-3-deoxyphosphogluconate aldolase/(4S)-4-hydroxy-2-oxoglutarate aldolase
MTPATKPPALETLYAQQLIGVVRAATHESALAAARAIAKGGISLVEITFTVPEAARAMAALAASGEAIVGAGTVLTADECRAALDAGARFIVAPNFSPAVARVALAGGAMYVPGAYTTNEILAARDGGAHVIKVYPVGVAGGPMYIQIIRDPLPNVPMLAAGGTSLDNLEPFLRAGCVGLGLGGALADPKLTAAGQFEEITRRARAFVQRVSEVRASGLIPAMTA